jgi:hypothetical protein
MPSQQSVIAGVWCQVVGLCALSWSWVPSENEAPRIDFVDASFLKEVADHLL